MTAEDDEFGMHSVTTPLYEMRIVYGLDSDGDAVTSTAFLVLGGDSEEIVPYVPGLGMLRAAEIDFVERHNG